MEKLLGIKNFDELRIFVRFTELHAFLNLESIFVSLIFTKIIFVVRTMFLAPPLRATLSCFALKSLRPRKLLLFAMHLATRRR